MIYFRFYRFGKNNCSLKLFGCTVWSYYYFDNRGWFRLFGYGLNWKDLNKYGLTFSERNDCSKWVKIGKYCVTYIN